MNRRGRIWIAELRGTGGELVSPGVGRWTPGLVAGDAVGSGTRLGTLEVLGRRDAVTAGDGVTGTVASVVGDGTSRPVGFGDVLFVLGEATTAAVSRASEAAGAVFRAPSSGRFYSRPGPGKPPFVVVGEVIKTGQTICLLEVMKSFHRVVYDGKASPVRVTGVVARDEADVAQGDVLLTFEDAGE